MSKREELRQEIDALHETVIRIEAVMDRKKDELAALVEQEKPQGLWRPTKDYFVVEPDGMADTCVRSIRACTERELAFGNCFPSRDIAERAAPLMARSNKIIAAALQADPEAGASDEERNWSVYEGSPGLWHAQEGIGYGAPVFVHTREQAEEMADILNEEGIK